ncbi:alpha-xenorhabdolysin family binary toxin subunit A [Pseudomonas putida]|uniref:alpha-xenorhabdolysin family binary toxin subunit A n=1 Tax=Pseudomonas putida TaxID=303 RepID=UPI0027623D7B|nr:alpha-xenorhabdolysin family binary toxin subunit A [Pseudomonas putida]EKT4482876.1 alpha-xenorhabdolysin family binary toxin subunit A [Pseudomonas putida]MDP9520180.1 alpha-xenorhabdolysin family binary toxin subunit A [Pseudomonas putida]
MNTATGQEEVPVDELDLVSRVKMLPERYFSFIESRLDGGQQVGGLLTADNLKCIKRYVNTVNHLPRTQVEIEREVDYAALGIKASMVNDLYVALHRHAAEWDILERSIKQLGPEIEMFAESLVQRGSSLLENLESSDVFMAIKKRKAEEGDDVYTSELSEHEQAQIASVVTLGISELVREIECTRRRIVDVDSRANWFNSEIKRELKPRMGRLLKHFDEKVSHEETLEKRRQLDQWDEQIDQLQAEYDANVGYAFTGILLGPIGLVITGGVFGSKAEDIRATKNALIERRDELANALGKLEPALKDFQRISTLVRDLQFRCKDLSAATKRLADVWLFLASYASNSVNEAKELSTIAQLESFVLDFSEVIKPWTKIRSVCHTLSALFNELIDEYEDA